MVALGEQADETEAEGPAMTLEAAVAYALESPSRRRRNGTLLNSQRPSPLTTE
jgi:hypothetical protein